MKIRIVLALAASVIGLAACDGLKEALTAHVDVAARAGDQELSVTRLSDLLGNSTLQVPVNRETAVILTDLWMNYELLGAAGARGDSLNDPKLMDKAALGMTANMRLRRFMDTVSKSFKADSASETAYNQAAGGLFVARHILLALPGGATQQQKDSVRRKAEAIRAQVTPANFADVAKRNSADPGSAARGGMLGAFRREDMVKPFSDAVAALRPGQISPLVETQYGYHIIERPTYAQAKAEYDAAFGQSSTQRAESLYVARVDSTANITVKASAPASAKTAVRDLADHRDDGEVMASFKGGDLTVGEFVRWVEAMPPQFRAPQQIQQAPDSLVRQFVKSIARNEVMLQKADSAGIKVSNEEQAQMYGQFKEIVSQLWQQLGVDPKQLADSAKSVPEREKLAATRIETYLDRVMAGQAQPLNVPQPVQLLLRGRFQSKVYPAGIDRAVERARKLRTTADSARQANQPRSQVPLPTPPADSAARRDTGTKRR